MALTPEQATTIYDLLVRHAEANERERGDFIRYVGLDEPFHEWRFGGRLGWGGKFAMQHGCIYIKFYPEDRTPDRELIQTMLHAEFAKLGFRVG